MRWLLTLVFVLLTTAAGAGSIQITVAENGFPNVSRTYNIPDADLVRMRAAYQSDANTAINGTATRVQVMNFWIMEELIRDTIAKVQARERQSQIDAAPMPAPITPQ